MGPQQHLHVPHQPRGRARHAARYTGNISRLFCYSWEILILIFIWVIITVLHLIFAVLNEVCFALNFRGTFCVNLAVMVRKLHLSRGSSGLTRSPSQGALAGRELGSNYLPDWF